MEFLKKHFEKAILLALLLLFVVLLLYLLKIVQSTQEVSEKDLQIPVQEANYQVTDQKDEKFAVSGLLKALEWMHSVPRKEANKEYFTDLLVPYLAARCGHCEQIIPRYFLDGSKQCPLCKKDLKAAPELTEDAPQMLDSDGDGIPDLEETRYGLNPQSREDALLDLDGDGFPNLYEYLMKTDMSDPLSHPPYYLRLYVTNLERQELPVMLRRVSAVGKDKSNWYAQLNSSPCYIGDTIKLDGKTYKVTDIISKRETKVVNGTTPVTVDASNVVLSDGRDSILLKVGERVYAPNQKVVVSDVWTGTEYKLDVGSKVTLHGQGKATDSSTYTVKSVDTGKREMELTDDKDGKEAKPVKIGPECQIPEQFRPKVAEQNTPLPYEEL